MTITIKEPHDLRATLAKMKAAQAGDSLMMCVWDRDIKAVEDAIAVIEGVRNIAQQGPNKEFNQKLVAACNSRGEGWGGQAANASSTTETREP